MNLDNIEEGQTFKNYKELCSVLGEEYNSGNSKKYQLKKWERYFNFHKEGRKYRIDHIYDKPKEKDNSRTFYINLIKMLLLDMLYEKDDTIYISKNNLLKTLSMINENYITLKYKQKRLAATISVTSEEIREFYQTSDNLFKRNLENAFNDLKNRSLVDWKMIDMVCFIKPKFNKNDFNQIKVVKHEDFNEWDENTVEFKNDQIKCEIEYRPATDSEIKLIMHIKNNLLELFNKQLKDKYNSNKDYIVYIKDVYTYGLQKDFFKLLNRELFDRANIYYTYKGFKFLFNQDDIAKEWKNTYQQLNPMDKYITKKVLNTEVVNKIKKNITNRHNKEITSPSEKYAYRLDPNYIENGDFLTSFLIDTRESSMDEELLNAIKNNKKKD